ncbi:MAG: hypothetical protein AB7O50_07855 [Pseudolabrys sp.]
MLTALPRVEWLASLNVLKKIDFAILRRSAAWASAAFIAAVTAIFAAGSDTGTRRVQQALSGTPEIARAIPVVAQIPPAQPELEKLARRLNDTVKQLAMERERLGERIASLERNLEDVTGSVRTPATTAAAPATVPASAAPPVSPAVPSMTIFTAVPPLPMDSPAVWPATRPAAAGETSTPAPEMPAQAAKPDTPPVPLPPVRTDRETTGSVAEPNAENAEARSAEARGANDVLGLDLGGARSIDALTIHWSALKVKFGDQLNSLIPVVSIRERKPGVPELRLIAGPVAGVEAATKLCMELVSARAPCRPTQFAGQRLMQR